MPAGWTIQQITHCAAGLACSNTLANHSSAAAIGEADPTTAATIVKRIGKPLTAGQTAVYTIGSTNPAGAANGTGTGITASSLWLTKRTLAGAAAGANWVALRAWVSGGIGETKLRLAIYDDLSNSPNNLVGGGEITVPLSAAAAEYTFTLPGTAPASNGAYWVGFHFNTTPAGPAPWYASSGGTMAYGNPGYAGGLPATYSETGVNGVNDVRVAADAAVSVPGVAVTATIARQPSKTLAATAAVVTASMVRQIGKRLSAAPASAATIVKRAGKTLTGAPAATGATLTPLYLHAGVTNPKALTATVTSAATLQATYIRNPVTTPRTLTATAVTTASLNAVKVTPVIPGLDQQDVGALVAAVGGGIGA